MSLFVCSLSSGSSGNCYMVRSEENVILIDAGISTKRIHESLESIGIGREAISGVFITHEHSDHVKGLKVLTKKNPEWKVYSSEGTGNCIKEYIYDQGQLECFTAGECVDIGDINIRSIRVSHDAADPVCYYISSGDQSILLLTDTGYVTAEAAGYMRRSEIIIIEANHEVNMLRAGSYPYYLKRRILGDKGHLSNEAAGEILAENIGANGTYKRILLAHLSKENNFPLLAEQTVKNILEENGFYCGRDFSIDVLKRDEISGITEI